jgi:hypothetical protein
MKRLVIAVPFIMLTLFAACKKASGPANGKSVQPDNTRDSLVNMAAIINGVAWKTDSAFGSYISHSGNDTLVNLVISATRHTNDSLGITTNSTITFNITNYSGPSSYTINPPLNTAVYYVGNERHFATSGVINITNDSGYSLLANFSFTADTIMVTNGSFDVSLP